MGGRGGGQRLLDGFRGKEGRVARTDWRTVGRRDCDATLPAGLPRFLLCGDRRAGRRSEKCSLKMFIARVAFWRRRAFLCLPAL